MDKKEVWIQTYCGKKLHPFNPNKSEINVRDIAVSLSRLCRFGGHTKDFYSVAQHSFLVSQVCDPKDALWGLLHDSAEAYVSDILAPIKRILPEDSELKEAERLILTTIVTKFGLKEEMPQSVKEADMIVLATEKRDLLKVDIDWEVDLPKPMEQVIEPWGMKKSQGAFAFRFKQLLGKLKGGIE